MDTLDTETSARPARATRAKRPKGTSFRTPDGVSMPTSASKVTTKFFRDTLAHWHGVTTTEDGPVCVYNPENPVASSPLLPGPQSPICQKCGLFEAGCRSPFMAYEGSENPVVTVIYEAITAAEDDDNELAQRGFNALLRKSIEAVASTTGVDPSDVRWVPLTRCAARKGIMNPKVKGNWCRLHLVDDLIRHPPRLIIPVGTAVLGLLSHKSNAQDWQGRLLTYRGWPDDWLTNPAFVLPRPHPANPEATIIGHPLFGPPPDIRIPMMPVQSTRLARAGNNQKIFSKWKSALVKALKLAHKGVKPNTYTRPWYRFTNDPDVVEEGLRELLEHPGLLVCYDTETKGLKPLAERSGIVSMMFRWEDPVSGKPKSLGFPWDFRSTHYTNRVVDHIPRLAPLVLQVLKTCRIVAHNATFDMLYTLFNVPNAELDALEPGTPEYNRAIDEHICAMASSFEFDTWHMAYTLRQDRGSLGLELMAYDYAPGVAGYEEDMTLLIELFSEQLFPGAKGANPDDPPHYLNIDESYYPDYVVPYVMGDVETCYLARFELERQLAETKTYRIPLADPKHLGRFRAFEAPPRDWVYTNIMSPSARMLMRVMARGMHVDPVVLESMEARYPVAITEAREKLRNVHTAITDWCRAEEEKDPKWALDLENKGHLHYILFDLLKLPVQRLTKKGRQLFGETPEDWDKAIEAGFITKEELTATFAALDKFTLNKLAVDHPQVRPLQEYRQVFKLYSTYVRPLRNIFTAGVDKKARVAEQHLCCDGRIHASFLLTGTRGGRLSCRDPNLQQLPNKGDVKQMFTSRFGARGCMYQADLSQIELRLMASACGDPTMVQAYLDKTDLHTLTTSRIFKLPYEHFSKEYFKWLQDKGRDKEAKELELKRRIGKTVNFLTGYGGGALGLQTVLAANQVYLSEDECVGIIDAFFDAYPALKQFLAHYKRFITDNGVACSIFGRVRGFDEVYGEDHEAAAKALRAGCNHIIQSTASDMMLTALVVIEDLMRAEGLESILVSTVHDSLLIDAVRDELPRVHDIVFPVLNNFDLVLPARFGPDFDTSWMVTPFAGDCEVGPSYYSTRKIPDEGAIDWDKLLSDDV